MKICVFAGLCCYVVMLGIIGLTHDHSAHSHCHNCHTEPSQSKDTCTACVFCSQHVGVEIESSALISSFLFSTTLPFYEAVFLPLRLTTNKRSRAPPIFSTELANYAL
ncbi:hypothetical protein F4054_21545 [Candidatus Poribacteria bacterium]|nr:hypothetical protein [Candidatus Poribacteria bacterium]MYK24833.1 hypothetical protein [Candidatus Poribacteria bacterium]